MKRIKIGYILVILVIALTGCGDDYYDEYEYGHSDEGYYERYYDEEYYDDGYADEQGYYDYGSYEIEVPENTNLKTSDYALGTCGEIEGTTLLVSVFLNDSTSSWEDNLTVVGDALKYTGIATEWISKAASSYGCDCEFIYDWNEYSDLYYEGTVDADMTGVDSNTDFVDEIGWKFIDENIDSKELLEKYNADNIGYMFYLNTPKSNNMTSCTRDYYEDMVYPYEMCYIYMFVDDEEETPAGIAHEILHTFGAPDLYLEDTDGENYGVSRSLVEELEDTMSNDIMFTTYDAKNGNPYFDRITNDFTDVDAYYVGLIDSCDFVDQWNLKPSQHE